jgi:hypothetical protein
MVYRNFLSLLHMRACSQESIPTLKTRSERIYYVLWKFIYRMELVLKLKWRKEKLKITQIKTITEYLRLLEVYELAAATVTMTIKTTEQTV